MLQRIIALSLRNAGLVVIFATVLVAMAWIAIRSLPVDVFPELNAPTVTIITESGGLTAEEVESFVSFPLESAVNGLPGMRRVRSASALGLSIVWVEFDWEVDIYRARQMVSERLSAVTATLPANTHVEMAPIGSITGEIMLIALRGDAGVDPIEVRSYAEYELRNRLLTVPGVAQVVAIGGHLPEYRITVREEALRLHGLTMTEIAEALGGAHNIDSAGFLLNAEGLELPLRQSGRVRSRDDIATTIIAMHDGAAIRVADVATVSEAGAFRRGAASDQGLPAVVVSIQKAPGTNTLALTQAIDDVLDRVVLPKGIQVNRDVFRQADFISRSVNNVVRTVVEATVIVTVILMLFLMNWRTTVITLTALPVSLGATLLAMWATGMTINVMTLGGLAVAIGILVDDAIIDVENVHRRLAEPDDGRSRLRVIFDASNEIRASVVFATLIICIVFVPLLFLQGLEGRFFRPLAITYMLSIMASLVVAMTLTPALCWYLLRNTAPHGDGILVRALKRIYRPALNTCLRLRSVTLSVAAGLTALALWLGSTFGSSFLPEFNEGTYTVFLMMPPGTSLEESERVALGVEQRLAEIPGIAHCVARSGRAERDEHAEPPSNTEIEVRMRDDADPRAVRAAIDRVVDGIPGITTSIGQPISHRLSHVLSGTSAQIAIDLYHEDLDRLRAAAKRVEAALQGVKGTRDVVANREVLVQTLAINFRRDDLARMGLSPAEAGAQVRQALFGETVSVINQGTRRIDVVLRLAEDQRDRSDDVGRVILHGKNGRLSRLHEVADIGPEQASNLITRQNAQRKTVVSCNLADGANLGDTVAAIRAAVDPIADELACTVHYGGQFEAQRSASRTLAWAGGLILIIMVILLQASLGGDLVAALVVLANLPLALIGGIVALFIAESPQPLANFLALIGLGGSWQAPVVSIASLVGFITLFGIAVRNGILLVNHIRWLRLHEGLDLENAVRRGSEERLVPVLMTALSAALGLIPLALRLGEPGSELLAPLAIVVLGGLLTSTILNMLVVPIGYHLLCRRQPLLHDTRDDLPISP